MAVSLGQSDNDGINDINITPFVDIVLVLLIIFMISTPAMIFRGVKVALPAVTNAEDMSHVTLKINMLKDGTVELDQKPVTMEELKRAIAKMKEYATPGDALISADALVPHGKVMEVSDFLKTQGVQQIAFGTAGGGPAKEAAKAK